METIIHKAKSRGHQNLGWLNTYHTFSFADYYDPTRVNFGALRVLNDDIIAPASGFVMHPHNNMEIITIPLSGSLEHKDSIRNGSIIASGEIQVMSAGSGIYHSEYNASNEIPVTLLQIWVLPKKKNVEPRYDQFTWNNGCRNNTWTQIISPFPEDEGSWIHQDSWFHLGSLDDGFAADYTMKRPSNGLYVFVIDGAYTVHGVMLEKRDGLGLPSPSTIEIISRSPDTRVLLMEVPI